MKQDIHPEYGATKIVCLSCGTEVETRATVPLMRVDLCSSCHPFYTGKQRIVDTAGRVDRFNQRRAASEKAAKDKQKREKTTTSA
jgi:large subunit ribosomal protein L31